jgi:hypothetical protein
MQVTKSDIYTELSKKYSLHRNIIIQICNHPFVFGSRRISDDSDEKSIMYPYFGKIKLKNRFKNRKQLVANERSEKAIEYNGKAKAEDVHD